MITMRCWIGGGHLVSRENYLANTKPIYNLSLPVNIIRNILPIVYPYLIIKKAKAKLLAEKLDIHVEETCNISASEKYSYIAGFLDGEGSLSFGQKYADYVRLSFGNTDRNCLEKIKAWLDNEGYITYSDRSKLGRKTVFNYNLCANKCRIFIPLLLPYLIIKKQQAIDMQKYLDEHIRRPAKERPNRAAYYKSRYNDPILRAKKLGQIKKYRKKRKKLTDNY